MIQHKVWNFSNDFYHLSDKIFHRLLKLLYLFLKRFLIVEGEEK